MKVFLSKECRAFATRLEILDTVIEQAFQQSSKSLVFPSKPPQLYVIRWIPGSKRIIFAHGIIRNACRTMSLTDAAVDVKFVIELKSRLPAGQIAQAMSFQNIFIKVAQSFGMNVSCHKEERPKKIYSGRWDGKNILFPIDKTDHYQVSGAFNVKEKNCQNVWVFSFKKYQKWFQNS